MSEALPVISVVVAVRDAVATVGQCIESVADQDYTDVDLVVIDGASSDGTVSVLERNTERMAYWESEPDRGIYHAWNKALDHVRGDWVCFLGADDRLASPDVLSRMAPNLAAASRDCNIVYGSVHVVEESGTVLLSIGSPWEEARAEFTDRMSLPNPATFYRRTLFDVHGRFDERYRIAGDYELLLRELLDHDALFVPDVVLVEMGAGGISHRPENWLLLLRENIRAHHAHGLSDVPEWRSVPLLKATAYDRLRRSVGPRVTDSVVRAYRVMLRRPKPPASA